MMRTLAALLLWAPLAMAETVSFDNDVQPILKKYCVMCHVPGAAQGDLALYPDAWKATVGAPSVQSPLPLIEPGDPASSYFYLKMTGEHLGAGGSGEIMPLAADELATIRTWIEQGARRN